jgi:Na+-driven multidrug efflux pump
MKQKIIVLGISILLTFIFLLITTKILQIAHENPRIHNTIKFIEHYTWILWIIIPTAFIYFIWKSRRTTI